MPRTVRAVVAAIVMIAAATGLALRATLDRGDFDEHRARGGRAAGARRRRHGPLRGAARQAPPIPTPR